MKKRCKYRYCKAEQFYFDNKTKHCDDTCQYHEKLERQKDQRNEEKSMLNEIKRNEVILRACYRSYGDKPFDINIVRDMRMNWVVTTGEIMRYDLKFTKVGSYAYAVILDNLILIINP
jgi:hypothetical protein